MRAGTWTSHIKHTLIFLSGILFCWIFINNDHNTYEVQFPRLSEFSTRSQRMEKNSTTKRETENSNVEKILDILNASTLETPFKSFLPFENDGRLYKPNYTELHPAPHACPPGKLRLLVSGG